MKTKEYFKYFKMRIKKSFLAEKIAWIFVFFYTVIFIKLLESLLHTTHTTYTILLYVIACALTFYIIINLIILTRFYAIVSLECENAKLINVFEIECRKKERE